MLTAGGIRWGVRWLFLIWLLAFGACQRAPVHALARATVVVAPPYCTLTLGVAQCFSDPASLPDHPPSLADGETALSPAQEKDRAAAARWWAFWAWGG